MPTITATRLHVRRLRHVPTFLWWSLRAARQAKRSPGHIASALHAQDARTYWTLSSWQTIDAMRRYRSSGAHETAMRRAGEWADEASTVRWDSDDGTLPDWKEAKRRLDDDPHTLRFD